ncbi:MAG: hypothetical protein ACJ8DZ_06135 [Allosphingosinicella sp.]
MGIEDVAAEKIAFEPSELIEYGEADQLTRGSHNGSNVDGDYTS